MKRVVLESPYSGDVERNLRYGRACMRDCLMRGEAPIASHLLYTQEGVLNDDDPLERSMGIAAGFDWNEKADAVVVYQDYGISRGMEEGIAFAKSRGIPVIYRNLL